MVACPLAFIVFSFTKCFPPLHKTINTLWGKGSYDHFAFDT